MRRIHSGGHGLSTRTSLPHRSRATAFAIRRCRAVLARAVIAGACLALLAAAVQAQRIAEPSERRFEELYIAGDYAAALDEARRLEAARRQRFGLLHPSYADALRALGRAHYARQEFADAERVFLRELEIRERTAGPDHRPLAA